MQSIELPALSAAQVRAVEQLMITEYHLTVAQMMENAGLNLALLAKRLLENEVVDRPVVLLAGRGQKGGSGLVAARHLLNWGAWVQILLTHRPEEFIGTSAQQLTILQAMEAPLAWAEEGWELPPADLVIDALIGSGLHGPPTDKARDLIQLANSSHAPILSLEAPSGLDTTTGELHSPHIRAAATLTLALPKTGLLTAEASHACGDLYLADVGVPPQLYQRLGLEGPPLFANNTIVPVTVHAGKAFIPVD